MEEIDRRREAFATGGVRWSGRSEDWRATPSRGINEPLIAAEMRDFLHDQS